MAQTNKVLVVDDEISLVQLCLLILEDAGYEVRGANSGTEALRLIDEDVPDLVLLDVMMPGMDGIELCRQIRRHYAPQRPYILMYTADDRELTRQNSMMAGANDLITKDTPVHELASRIDEFMTFIQHSPRGVA
ncbi:MAG: response regulator [Anaerolineae bacterium]|nr:response regulator [Anaerolineae bacterium]